ncbi:sensor histidine kinase [Vallitalea okinawensis]|uniref:sensor histidine kinase n=1 Tax=Vallitalea okinawensis TaxID=2078660 RepID=UPI000CFD5FB7|nr:ATP-binding protein [Vallitalea okinawensis]
MIKTVRMKLFLYFIIFLIFFVSLSIVMNVHFFEAYFSLRVENDSISAFEYINSTYSDESKYLEQLPRTVGAAYNLKIVILDSETMSIKYSTEAPETINHILVLIKDLVHNSVIDLRTGYIYETIYLPPPNELVKDPRQVTQVESIMNENSVPKDDARELIFIKKLDTGDLLVLRKPLHVITDNSKIINEFMVFVSAIIILLGSIIIFFLSKRISQPIVELSKIAKGISNLDFSKKYEVKTKDEIGLLGDSINLISEELHKALDDLIEANAELKEDVERKKQIDEMRKNFISSVSHELKSPIGITRGYAEGLKYNIANDEEKKKRYYDILIDEADKMDKMVKQLLSLSTLESDIFELDQTIFNITVLIEEVVEKFDPIIQDKDITIEKIVDEDYFVKGDYPKIEQVISNYLTNAINHVDEHRYIEIKTQLTKEKVRISVTNSGNNIPLEDLDSIWESFYKVDKARSREYGGTGLGLSIVKSIMEHHQEMYGVINRDDGVEFWFELNIVSEKE